MISRKVDALFTREEKTITTLQEGGLIRLKASLIEVPELRAVPAARRCLRHPGALFRQLLQGLQL